ncbi:hypothetical protein JCM15908A_05770 [Prevotella dentasini JCM 15908]
MVSEAEFQSLNHWKQYPQRPFCTGKVNEKSAVYAEFTGLIIQNKGKHFQAKHNNTTFKAFLAYKNSLIKVYSL